MDAQLQPQPQHPEQQPKTLTHSSLYYTYLQRYYTTYQSQNQYVHMHSNGLFLVGVKPSALTSKPVKIVNVLEPVQVRGKKKKGGVRVKAKTHIAHVIFENNEVFKVEAKVEGTVIQYNENVNVENVGKQEGYLVVIMASKKFICEEVGMEVVKK